MEVLMVGPSKELQGGIATVVSNYLDSNLANEFKIKYVNTVERENKYYKIYSAIKAYIKILWLLIFANIDIVHIHLASRGSFNRKKHIINLSKLFKKKIIIHLHGAEFKQFYYLESSDKKKKEIRDILNKSDIVIALSYKWMEELKKITNSKVCVVHNSVSCKNVNLYNENSKNIIFLGRLDKRKGIFDLLDVIENVLKKYPEYNLLLCGDGDLETIRKIIRKKNIANNVKVMGWISGLEKERIMKNCAINILPSYNEGLPMSILEAMSFGIPTISTEVGGIPDVISNRINGFIISPGDKEMLEYNILELLSNVNIRKDISNSAFNTIIKDFNIDSNIIKIKNIYNSLK